MLDPLSAISLASSIVQFIDFSAEIIRGAREVHGSMSGATERNRSLEVVVSQTRNLTSKLSVAQGTQQSEDDKALGRVANECKILADQILDLLQKIKAKDPDSTIQAVWAALKNQKYKRERLELEGRLESCRNNLEFQLSFLTSAETKARLNALVTSAEDLAGNLELLQRHVEQLRLGTRVTSISPEAQKQVRELLNLSEEGLRKIKQHRVLKSLAYTDMDTRFEDVSEEHSKTFEWIFGDTTQGGNQHRDTSGQESFVDWLSVGRGIFHICGKLGSGKSTLMKFLCNHPRTKTELQHWAGGRKLIFAKFFFWRGAKKVEQKSLTGLVRSLLYETLSACPELVSDVLPDLWAQLESVPWQVETKLDLRKLQTRAAISNLINHRNLYKEHCFCFFIDGLDEFDKTPQDGYGDLIQLLSSWAEAAPEDVKICVSSREDLVFMNAFSDERRFRLQDLTREDIQRYVRDKLPVAADEKGEELVKKITHRADGIFLWVALVVKSIRDLLDEDYELSDVEQELDRLPNELYELFEYLLRSISSSGRKRAHRTFAMVLKLRAFPVNLSLLAYSFLGDYEKDPAFAMETSFACSDTDGATRREREDVARKNLYRDCRRLLEVGEDGATITVTHRSILEFLESQDVKADMKCNIDGFSTEDAISQLFLAELQWQNGGIDINELSLVVYALIDMRNKGNIDQEPYRFQEALSSTVIQRLMPDLKNHVDHYAVIQVSLSTGAMVTGSAKQMSATTRLTSPLHISAFCGACEYVAWKMQQDPSIIKNAFEIAVIACCLEFPPDDYSGYFDKRMKLLDSMLTQGLCPNAIIHTCSANSTFPGELSFWQHFFLTFAVFEPLLHNIKREFGGMVERFLELGADPHLWLSNPLKSPEFTKREEILRVTLGRERHKSIEFTKPSLNRRTASCLVEEGMELSLREMIEFWKFDNERAILQLLDRNAERQELMANVDNMAHDRLPRIQEDCVKQDLDIPDTRTELHLTPESTLEEAEEEPLVMKPPTSKDSGSWLESTARTPVLSFILGILVAFVLPQLWTIITTHSSTRGR